VEVERWWLRPKWVAGTVLAVVLVVLFVNLGFWQLRRLDEKRDRNALVEERASAPVEPVGDVVDPAQPFGGAAAEDVVHRRVEATGTYDEDGAILVRNRSLNGRPGSHVLTPLVTEDDAAVVVNRGFVPTSVDDPPPPPSGEVEVHGILLATQERSGIGPRDPARGTLDVLSRVDLARLQQQYGRDLYPVYLQATSSTPAEPDDLPVLVEEPDRGEGPHLSYAVQWFLFALVGAVGWPVLLRRTAHEHRRRQTIDVSDVP
jgi:surfeit locus 1 family protein